MKPDFAMTWTPDVFQGLDEARQRRRQRPRREVGPTTCGAGVEPLETRQLLSVNLSVGVLSITGTGSADTYEIYQVNGSPTLIRVVENGTDLGNAAWTGAAVTRIEVATQGGDDTVVVQINTVPGRDPMTEVTRMHGGTGADNLSGGPMVDTIYGDDGDDFIYGFGDNDILYGGYGGGDYMEGGNGNDLMYGGDGGAGGSVEVAIDELHGQDGNDAIYGEGGNDILVGEAGNDSLYGGDGNDNLTGNDGNDYMAGENGNDTFFAGGDPTFVDSLLGGAGSDGFGNYDAGTDILLDTIPG